MRMALLAALSCLAAPVGPVGAQDAEEGQAIFDHYCATCHGPEARGDGVMAGVLVVAPSNLRTLSSRNGGDFPLRRVVERIDGQDPLMSHGSAMPVWGPFFQGGWDVRVETLSGEAVETSRPIAHVVSYLMSVQDE